jgi:transcriptional regulator of met regulon
VSATGDVDDIRLTLPALPEYGRLVRQCAAGLGLRRRLGFRSVDDLRLAVDETIIALLDDTRIGGRMRLVFHVTGDEIGLDAVVHESDGQPRPLTADARERFQRFVGDLVDEYDVDLTTGQINFVKRARTD